MRLFYGGETSGDSVTCFIVGKGGILGLSMYERVCLLRNGWQL
jgi:hypothetical protein